MPAGDRLRLRVSNRNDVFALGSADFVLEDSKDQRLSLTVYQHGGIHAAFVDDRNAESGTDSFVYPWSGLKGVISQYRAYGYRQFLERLRSAELCRLNCTVS